MVEREADELVRAVLAGDLRAYEGIIERYQRPLWQQVAYYVKSRAEIEELVHQAFVKAYFALEQFRLGEDLGNWLRAIARNEVKMALRKRLSERQAKERYADRVAVETALADLDEDRADEMRAYLADCLRQLPEAQKAVVEARYGRQESIGRIAERGARSVDAVKKVLSRARAQLRDCVQRKALHGAR